MPYDPWVAAAAGEYGVLLPVLFAAGIFALFVKRQNDPLRKPFLWMKLAMPFFFLFAVRVAFLVTTRWIVYARASYGLDPAALFFYIVSDCFILLCLVQLGVVLRGALNRGRTGREAGSSYPGARFVSSFTYSAIVFLAVVGIIAVGFNGAYSDASLHGRYSHSATPYTANRSVGIWIVFYWFSSLPMTVLSAIVLYHSIRQRRFRVASPYLLAAVLLNVIRITWRLAYAIKYLLPSDPDFPPYIIVISPILYAWVTVFMFGVLVALGLKRNGLWSLAQPQLPFDPALPPRGFNQVDADYYLHQQAMRADVPESDPRPPERVICSTATTRS